MHCQIVSSFVETKKYSPGTTPSPELLARTDLPPPDSSESWHVLPCSASTVRASEKSSLMANRKSYMGFPTSHQPRFYAAPNFLTMGIKYLNLSSFIQVSTIKNEKSAAKFHYIMSSAVAEMGDRGYNRHGPTRGECCAPFAERWKPV